MLITLLMSSIFQIGGCHWPIVAHPAYPQHHGYPQVGLSLQKHNEHKQVDRPHTKKLLALTIKLSIPSSTTCTIIMATSTTSTLFTARAPPVFISRITCRWSYGRETTTLCIFGFVKTFLVLSLLTLAWTFQHSQQFLSILNAKQNSKWLNSFNDMA